MFKDGRHKVFRSSYQVIIVQWLALQLATGEVPGLNPIKVDND